MTSPNRPLLFWEVLTPGGPTFFDAELDQFCQDRLVVGETTAGHCNLCDSDTRFLLSTDNIREDLTCAECGSINRHRQLTCALSIARFGHPFVPLPELARSMRAENARLYTAEANSTMYRRLEQELGVDLLACSEYFGPDHRSGDIVDRGIQHQDLRATSFGDGEFPVVLTSEVMEHVPHVERAEAEIVRILAPGGSYCFTAPFTPSADDDIVLATMHEDGTIEHFGEPQYHGDPVRPEEGILVFQVFSHHGLRRRFESLGCAFRAERFWSPHLGILGANAFTLTVTKPGS